jgi:hypothetical protein
MWGEKRKELARSKEKDSTVFGVPNGKKAIFSGFVTSEVLS